MLVLLHPATQIENPVLWVRFYSPNFCYCMDKFLMSPFFQGAQGNNRQFCLLPFYPHSPTAMGAFNAQDSCRGKPLLSLPSSDLVEQSHPCSGEVWRNEKHIATSFCFPRFTITPGRFPGPLYTEKKEGIAEMQEAWCLTISQASLALERKRPSPIFVHPWCCSQSSNFQPSKAPHKWGRWNLQDLLWGQESLESLKGLHALQKPLTGFWAILRACASKVSSLSPSSQESGMEWGGGVISALLVSSELNTSLPNPTPSGGPWSTAGLWWVSRK